MNDEIYKEMIDYHKSEIEKLEAKLEKPKKCSVWYLQRTGIGPGPCTAFRTESTSSTRVIEAPTAKQFKQQFLENNFSLADSEAILRILVEIGILKS